ncbi:MAG: precorrin-8X methylmutase, partial [Microcoleus sp.]
MLDYIRDGTEIYTKSFATIRAEADLSKLPPDLESVAVRLIHSCGMTDIVADLAASPGAATAGYNALTAGAPILCDSRMVAEGITRKRLPADNPVICTLWHPEVPELALQIGNTRS